MSDVQYLMDRACERIFEQLDTMCDGSHCMMNGGQDHCEGPEDVLTCARTVIREVLCGKTI